MKVCVLAVILTCDLSSPPFRASSRCCWAPSPSSLPRRPSISRSSRHSCAGWVRATPFVPAPNPRPPYRPHPPASSAGLRPSWFRAPLRVFDSHLLPSLSLTGSTARLQPDWTVTHTETRGAKTNCPSPPPPSPTPSTQWPLGSSCRAV